MARAITKIEIESLDKEYLVFTTSRPTGLPYDPTTAIGPLNYVHRYVIKTEDAKKVLQFLNLSDFWNRRAEVKGDADAD